MNFVNVLLRVIIPSACLTWTGRQLQARWRECARAHAVFQPNLHLHSVKKEGKKSGGIKIDYNTVL